MTRIELEQAKQDNRLLLHAILMSRSSESGWEEIRAMRRRPGYHPGHAARVLLTAMYADTTTAVVIPVGVTLERVVAANLDAVGYEISELAYELVAVELEREWTGAQLQAAGTGFLRGDRNVGATPAPRHSR
ncbi:hypothetical protein AB0333_16235 [Citricoccus sp. NPDC079358]|uniref:hypothetical protein n=1 Tax=Citricoccus sp. NPDC079358 TaxID=3154653 RepID=UPI00344B5DDA